MMISATEFVVSAPSRLIRPNDDHAVAPVGLRRHDLRDENGKEMIALGDGRLVAGISRAVVSEPGRQCRVISSYSSGVIQLYRPTWSFVSWSRKTVNG